MIEILVVVPRNVRPADVLIIHHTDDVPEWIILRCRPAPLQPLERSRLDGISVGNLPAYRAKTVRDGLNVVENRCRRLFIQRINKLMDRFLRRHLPSPWKQDRRQSGPDEFILPQRAWRSSASVDMTDAPL